MAKLIAAVFLLTAVIVAEGIKVGDNCTTVALQTHCSNHVYGACEINEDCHCAISGTTQNADGSKCLGDAGSGCAVDSFCASDDCNMNTYTCRDSSFDIAGLQWSSTGLRNNSMVYAYATETLSLPWSLTIGPRESIVDISWFVTGTSQEMIAAVAHGSFLTMPAFAGRVRQLPNAGIELDNMSVSESGTYSVEVVGRSAEGTFTTLRRFVNVLVEGLLDETVSFHAEVGPNDVVVNDATTLVLAQVLRNHGNGYDRTTGIFTAPYSGTYCFLANAFSAGNSGHSLEIIAANRGVSETSTWPMTHSSNERPASLHAIVSLKAGNTVYLVNHGAGSYFGHVTSFSGFLVDHTPN